jgi:RimJ/RimL family protein N-acetyltransferase
MHDGSVYITGKHIDLRQANLEDAAFILSLRTDATLNIHMNPVADDLDAQRAWMKSQDKPNNFYFIILDKSAQSCGTLRLYDGGADFFHGASWILKKGAPFFASIESFYRVFDFGFEYFGCPICYFTATKANTSLVQFYERMKAERIDEDETLYYLRIDKAGFYHFFERYKHHIGID